MEYSKYTDVELNQALAAINNKIFVNENGNDYYYSSPDYKKDRETKSAIQKEIDRRKSNSEIFNDIMNGYLKVGL